ncbi:MAG: CcdC protein domain-containing protein [Tumebacillaceae bacterium]
MGYNKLLLVIIAVTAFIFFRQVSNMYRPMRGNGTRIILTLILVIPGEQFIANPNAHATASQVFLAILIGAAMSLPLILTTHYEIRTDGQIYAKHSITFMMAFLAVFAFRWILRAFIDMDVESRMMLFFIVALAYLVPWKIVSFYKYRKVYRLAK